MQIGMGAENGARRGAVTGSRNGARHGFAHEDRHGTELGMAHLMILMFKLMLGKTFVGPF